MCDAFDAFQKVIHLQLFGLMIAYTKARLGVGVCQAVNKMNTIGILMSLGQFTTFVLANCNNDLWIQTLSEKVLNPRNHSPNAS